MKTQNNGQNKMRFGVLAYLVAVIATIACNQYILVNESLTYDTCSRDPNTTPPRYVYSTNNESCMQASFDQHYYRCAADPSSLTYYYCNHDGTYERTMSWYNGICLLIEGTENELYGPWGYCYSEQETPDTYTYTHDWPVWVPVVPASICDPT